jgi:hypothetical protein
MSKTEVVVSVMLTTEEVANLFRVSTAHVKRWAVLYPKQLGAVKRTPRGAWLFPDDLVRAALVNGLVDETEVAA